MVRAEFQYKAPYLLLVFSVILLSLAYQVKTSFEIDLGEPGDEAYIHDFHDIEIADGLSYRWSGDRSSILVPGIGGYAPARLRLRLNGWRPADLSAPAVTLSIGNRELTSFTPTDEFETFEFDIPRGMIGLSGNLDVTIDSEFFVPDEETGGGDLRKLGVLVDSVAVELQGGTGSIVTPPPLLIIYLVGGVLAFYLVSRWLLPRTYALGLAIPVLIGLSLMVGLRRVHMAPYSLWILVIPSLGVLIVELARREPTMAKGVPLATSLVLATTLGFTRFASVASLSSKGIAPDLANNYAAALVLRSGGMIYNPNQSLFVGYDNPPLTAILTMPLTVVDLQTAIRLLFLLNVTFLVTALTLICVARREFLLRYPYGFIGLALVLNLDPVQDSMLLGQLDASILLLIVIAFWAYMKGRDVLAGVSLGLAAMIKISPAFLILYFLLKRRFRLFASALITALLIGALSWLFVGTETYVLFITNTLPTLLQGSAQMDNQSLNGFFNRLFLGPSFTASLVEVPPLPQVRVLTLVTSLLLVGITAFLTWKKPISRDDLRFDMEFSLVVIILPLISSIAWHHYMTWYVLPLFALLNPRLRNWVSRKTYLVLAAVVSLFYLTLCIPIASYAPGLLEGPAELVISTRLYGALAFYGVFACFLIRQPAHSQANSRSE